HLGTRTLFPQSTSRRVPDSDELWLTPCRPEPIPGREDAPVRREGNGVTEELRRLREGTGLPAGRGIPEGHLDAILGGIRGMHVDEDGQSPSVRGSRKDPGSVTDSKRVEGLGSLIMALEDVPLEAAPVRLAGFGDVAA